MVERRSAKNIPGFTPCKQTTSTTLLCKIQENGGGVGRANANGVDLNRNFPDQFHDGSDHDSLVKGREPETLAAMKWIASNPFVLSGTCMYKISSYKDQF
jgi:hypothetical protein